MAVGVSFLVLFIGAFLGGVGLLILAKRRSNAFKKLPYPKPETLWGNVAAARQSLQPEAVNPFQLSMPRDDEEAARNQVFYRNMKGLDRLPYINTERPPSYPEYFPSETHDINRELGRERELSPSTTTIVLDRMSVTRSTTLDRSGRHYDPRGPLTLSQPRISKSLPKTPFIRSIAGPAPWIRFHWLRPCTYIHVYLFLAKVFLGVAIVLDATGPLLLSTVFYLLFVRCCSFWPPFSLYLYFLGTVLCICRIVPIKDVTSTWIL